MRPDLFEFSEKWRETINRLPETGMGYTVVTITLKDGRVFPQSIIDSGYLTKVRGHNTIPFREGDILQIVPTHDRWDWTSQPTD
jgi:hypothetical protein